jgi:hypothetical protein
MEDIFKKPDPNTPEATYYEIAIATKSDRELLDLIDSLYLPDDAKILELIFKRAKDHDVQMIAGKRLYYNN